MKRCVIVGGADIGNYEYVRSLLSGEDFFVFCDSGLKHMDRLGVRPSLIVGDFDSHENPHLEAETIVLPREKDDTDTVYGVKEALKRGFDTFLLIGVVGGRLDHTLGNVSILLYLDAIGKKGLIVDDYSEMEIVSSSPVSVSDRYAYFSLLNVSGRAKGVTIQNAKYPLDNAEITCEYQYGISNEVLPGRTALVSVRDGRLLLIKVFAK
jgi:thiamine pyrophosphokinase